MSATQSEYDRALGNDCTCGEFLCRLQNFRRPSLSNVPVQLSGVLSGNRFVPLCQLRRANKSEISDSAVRPRQRFPTLINATRSADSQVGLSRSEHRSSDRVHWLFGLQDYVTPAGSICRDCRANPRKIDTAALARKCQRILTRLTRRPLQRLSQGILS